MEFDEAATLIEAYLKTQWPIAYPPALAVPTVSSIPLIFPNMPRPTFEAAPVRVHVEIRAGGTRFIAFGGVGNNRQRQTGDLIMRNFVPALTTEITARAMASAQAKMMRGWSSGNCKFFTAGPIGGEASEQDGNWWQMDMLASFTFDSFG